MVSVSKQLFLDGHYANAAEDAFIEINDRVKRIYKKINPETTKVPDGDAAMTTVFSVNNPLLKICDTSTESGQNEQKGFMFMLQGTMSALRNPKAHANITITQDDAIRRIMFASMLMYKIDEAVVYSGIQEYGN
ncbi:MAG: TIGR02391 family protein [Clostridia bacterium]|nr:TIGR02391 family protein [Clostridia bacterium]